MDELDEVSEALDKAQITDWLVRADGSYTRLIRFAEPITETTRMHVCLCVFLTQGPGGERVLPGENSDELSVDRRLLRLRVTPRPTPRLHDQQFTPTNLFSANKAYAAS